MKVSFTRHIHVFIGIDEIHTIVLENLCGIQQIHMQFTLQIITYRMMYGKTLKNQPLSPSD